MNKNFLHKCATLTMISFSTQVLFYAPSSQAKNYILPVRTSQFDSHNSQLDVLSVKNAFNARMQNHASTEDNKIFDHYYSRAGFEKVSIEQESRNALYTLKSGKLSFEVDFSQMSLGMVKINSETFQFDNSKTSSENAEKLQTFLLKLSTPKLSLRDKALQVIIPSAHAIDTWMIVAGVAAVAAVIWAISSYNKYKKSKDARAASDSARYASDQKSRELEAKFKEEEKIHNDRCRGSASEGSHVDGCESWWYSS